METSLLKEVVIIFSLSIAVLLICHRLHIPTVVGFLLTGILCGPHALRFIRVVEDVQTLAMFGVILLLFTLGMEFSFKKVLTYKRYFFVGGSIQVVLTVLVGILIGRYLDKTWSESILLGFLLSLSSTAIVLRILDSRRESNTPHGHLILGILIFQDIIAVPMMLFIPVLGDMAGSFDVSFLYRFGFDLIILLLLAFCAKKFIPKLLYYVASTRNKELFLLSVVTICFAIAWITSSLGLSLSLGAFVAGLIISESEYSSEAVGEVIPFKDIFTSFFFVSIGMLLDLHFVIQQPLIIILSAIGVLCLKSFIASLSAVILGMPIRTAVLTGIALSQVGEFSFVLAKSGIDHGLANDYRYQLFLSVSLLTMVISPLLIIWAHYVARLVSLLPFPPKIKTGLALTKESTISELKNHIIIVGFGLSGKSLARCAKEADIDYVILEMNPEKVKQEKVKREPIYFGDATHSSVLHHVNIRKAQAVAVVVNDPLASLHIVKLARELNPDVYIIVRTHHLQEVHPMFHAGANDVVPDEFGTSVEIFTRVLRTFQLPPGKIEDLISELRVEGYEQLYLLGRESLEKESRFHEKNTEIATFHIQRGSPFVGNSLGDLNMRKNYGLTVLLIKRKNHAITAIDANTILMALDTIIVAGFPENLRRAEDLFKLTK
jgi:monovalent cation:H+ antiporter-2, CPA2 family